MKQALASVIAIAEQRAHGRVPIVGVSGGQGAGKTTLIEAAVGADPTIAAFSLDDVYLGSQQRRTLSVSHHPLFATRGPPGTHDLPLLSELLDRLSVSRPSTRTAMPRFDKLSDDRRPADAWRTFIGRPSLILIDGWCLGATPETDEALAAPINELERREDVAAVWRRTVNDALKGPYQAVFARFDAILHLRAPRFETIGVWRRQQEEGLLGRALLAAECDRIDRFVSHFERITRHMLAGGRRAEVEVELGDMRDVRLTRSG